MFDLRFAIRPCQTGILLSVNSSLINLGTYSQKHTNRKRKHKCLRQKQCIIYIFNGKKHHHNMKHWSELFTLTALSMTKNIWCNIKRVFHVKYVLY